MHLPEFVVYIHNGAYTVAQQVFLHYLTIEDRKSLRQVSRVTNLVMIEYPLITSLHMSTHKADLEYVERILKNEILFRHITTLSWDHSLHEYGLLDGDMHLWYDGWWAERVDLQRETVDGEVLQSHVIRKTPAIIQWEKLAKAQKRNLEQNRDIRLIMKVLPLLTNIENVVFTVHDFTAMMRNQAAVWSPAIYQWTQNSDQFWDRMMPPFAGEWMTYGIRYFSPLLRDLCTDYTSRAFPLRRPESNNKLWHRLPVRGINFFDNLARHRTGHQSGGRDYTGAPGLQSIFPKLATLEVANIQHEFLTSRYGGTEYEFLQASTRGLQRLDVGMPLSIYAGRDDGHRYVESIGALILPVTSSLRYLTLSNTGSSIIIAIDLLPRLTMLSHLVITDGLATEEELMTLGEKVHRSRSLKGLFLVAIHLSCSTWTRVLHRWRRSGSLNRLENVQIESVTDSRARVFGEPSIGFTRTLEDKSAIVQWLRRELDLYPMYVQRLAV